MYYVVTRVGRYIYYGLKDPRASLVYLTTGRRGMTYLFLKRLLGVNRNVIGKFLNELKQDRRFIQYVQSSLAEVGRYIGEISEPEILYVIVRLLKPEKVVETGVAAGVSSAFILEAMDDNGIGTLYSIDLPNYEI